ncbi:MAG: flavin reductase family protein [Acidobacteria bacterium]|nr:flavin reductase family protein [Acidobacteriota bacterium]
MTFADDALFKDVLGHYASGLVVVSAITPAGPAGFTCQTFGSLSLQPPLVTFAASSAGNSWRLVRQSSAVGISVLSRDQSALARRFAVSGTDKFDGVGWDEGPDGSPLLHGAIAHIEGRFASISSHGDHDIAVVEVTFVAASSGRPLIYFRSGFAELT